MKIYKYLLVPALLLGLSSCGSDYLDTDYQSGVSQERVDSVASSNSDVMAKASVTGIYSYMASWNSTGADAHDDCNYMGIMIVADMTGQDCTPTRLHLYLYDYQFDNRMETYRRTRHLWTTLYTMIQQANNLIDLIPSPTSSASKAYVGQAYAVRALSYYYLIQLYQKSTTSDATVASLPGVPLKYATSEGKEDKLGRNTVADVHAQIEADLNRADTLTAQSEAAGYTRDGKTFIDNSVVKGIEARYYLLAGKWSKADTAAKEALNSADGYATMSGDELYAGFYNINSSDVMWGFDHNTETATSFVSFSSMMSNLAPGYAGNGYTPKAIDAPFYDSIPATDARKSWFLPKPKKYLNVKFVYNGADWSEDYLYMLASEMVLIEAEALAHLGKNTDAATVLGALMAERDASWSKTSVTVEDVYLQRRIELWGEGFDYFDHKRLGIGVDRTYTGSNHLSKKVVPAGDKRWLYQIPQRELQENTAITENDQ